VGRGPNRNRPTSRSISRQTAIGRLWDTKISHAIGYAMHRSRSDDAVIRVYDPAGNVIETHEHKVHFKEPFGLITV